MSPTGVVVARLLRNRSALAGGALLLMVIIPVAIGPFILGSDPLAQDLSQALQPPSDRHLLGTDELGRDVLSRILSGGRYSLSVAVGSVAIAVAIGLPLGAISGYMGGWTDMIMQRVNDMLLSFPGLMLALALVAAIGVGTRSVVVAVAFSTVPDFVRLARASTLSVRETGFVEAARSLGVPQWLILTRHVVPNVLGPIIVQASIAVGTAILIASGLGFLGLGVQSPAPEWGAMLGDGQDLIFSHSILVTAPGVAIAMTVLGMNLFGDGLRDATDPRT
jgi:ABC-type dipeptide/oligopeptide/nickel transport system permease subunit